MAVLSLKQKNHVSFTSNSITSSSTWRILILGGALGYLLAMASPSTMSCSFSSQTPHGRPRWLSSTDQLLGVEEKEEEGSSAVTMDTTVTLIVLLLIALTIAFETAKEHIEETADRYMRPIISSLFGEMTILGFLSIFTVCVTKLGVFEQLSITFFGEEAEEELLETFEFVHYMLFLIMVFFVVSVLSLVASAHRQTESWRGLNLACQDAEYMTKLDTLLQVDESTSSPENWLVYLRQSLLPCFTSQRKALRSELALFRRLRDEFVLERSLEPPFRPHATNRVADDFDYGRYLGICLANGLAHIVHVNLATWSCFGLLTIIFFGLSMAVEHQLTAFAWVWAATGWLLVFVGNYFDYHIQCILRSLAVPSSISSSGTHTETEAALLIREDALLPAWTRIDLDVFSRDRGWLVKWLRTGQQSAITRQDALYLMDRKGPKVYMIVFQIQLVFTSAYISLLLLSFLEHMYAHVSTTQFWAYVVASILPVFYLSTKFERSAANMTMACSFGIHRRPQAVSQVIRDEKVDRIIRAMVVMHKLELVAGTSTTHGNNRDDDDNGNATAAATEHSSSSASHHGHSYGYSHNGHASSSGNHSQHHLGDLSEVAKAFDALDSSGNGKIENDELKIVLKALGAPASEESLDAILRVLDTNGDGHVAKDEFLVFYSRHVLAVDYHALHDLAHELYHRFDRDGSGQITLGEFKEVLDAFNVGFTVNEIGHLVNELDEHDDGTVGEHEFLQLLKKHHDLFEPFHLPALE